MKCDKIPYIHDPVIHNKQAAYEVVPLLMDIFAPRTVIDVGCGTGTWLSVFKEKGVSSSLGIDGNYIDTKLLQIDIQDFLAVDLRRSFSIQRKFDLVISLEVAEHLPSESANAFIESLTNLGNVIIFSAAIPEQGGQNHINEQWPNYWEEKFRLSGFIPVDILRFKIWQNTAVEWWYRQNILIYIRQGTLELQECKPKAVVHPELFTLKCEEVKLLQNRIDLLKDELTQLKQNPSFVFSIKLLIKSILKFIKP